MGGWIQLWVDGLDRWIDGQTVKWIDGLGLWMLLFISMFRPAVGKFILGRRSHGSNYCVSQHSQRTRSFQCLLYKQLCFLLDYTLLSWRFKHQWVLISLAEG